MPIHTRAALAAAAGLGLAVTGTLAAGPSVATTHHRAAVQRLEARLQPSGDPNGHGEAHLTLNKAHRKVCATVTWQDIDTPDAAHIHRASDGSIVVDLTGSVTGGSHCATGVPKRTIAALLQHPGAFYLNVHNSTYPAGAIQGKLRHG